MASQTKINTRDNQPTTKIMYFTVANPNLSQGRFLFKIKSKETEANNKVTYLSKKKVEVVGSNEVVV